ncbi:MAG TPA: endonuclease/exonuclease/phosphatase family protein [Polyangiaceae bacterium]|nr:endonuclease/exonuclease/phosphatase family protein [Polyangiaceae bacterium]
MTYNILTGGRDSGGESRLGTIVDVIRSVAPDVLLLEECNGFELDGLRTLYQIEHELGMRSVLATADSGFHVALFLRRGRLLETRCLRREVHHAVLAATLELDGVVLGVIGAHLCPFGGDARLLEVQHIMRFLRERDVFVLGDLNGLSPHDATRYQPQRWLPRRRARHVMADGTLDTRALAALEGAELVDVFHASGNSAATALTHLGVGWEDYQARIDYILASPAAAQRVERAERVDGERVEAASDHYPLFVDVRL